ncbi:50S ribosomal protein L23 [Patescibacteria group bacterium]
MKQIITRPVITEKSLSLAAKGWYTFEVLITSNKGHIASEVSKLFNVDVLQVRTVSMHGKMRRVGKKMKHVQKPDWKKAIVQVKEGQKIDIFEVTPDESAQPTK